MGNKIYSKRITNHHILYLKHPRPAQKVSHSSTRATYILIKRNSSSVSISLNYEEAKALYKFPTRKQTQK
ncbi:hypothetical protein YC2023_077781 [Brassica napus]